ncbi:hypothetical protein T492DRAFT_915758, partial [Pavlovales sp. CCMP2436]
MRLDDGLASELSCPSCLSELDDSSRRPMLLAPCGHTFCADCVERWRRDGVRGDFACPTCAEENPGREAEASVPFRNTLVESLCDRMRAKQQ